MKIHVPALPLLLSALLTAPANAQSALLLVTNQKDHNVSLVDPETDRQIATIAEDRVTGHEIAASTDGRHAFVPIYGDAGVGRAGTDGREMIVLDIPARKISGTVDFGRGVRPHCPILRNGKLYVTTELNQTVSVIDPNTLKIVGAIPTGQPESHMLALSHDGGRGYTANVGPGTVSVLDMKARKLVTVIPVSPKIQRISVSNDDSRVFTSDVTQPRLAVINTSTDKVESWVPLPGNGYGTASTRDGRTLLVAIPTQGKVVAIDLATLKVVRSLDVPSAPQEILVRPDGREAFVSCNVSHKIAVIDLAQWKVKTLIDVGNGADGLAWFDAGHSVASR